MHQDTTITYTHQDHLSGTSMTSNTSGAATGTIKFFPFGATRSGSVPTDKLFTGQRLDTTGLYYYNARYYDPTIGRFISADSIVANPANPQDLNRYSYVYNNPLKYNDPTGHYVHFEGENRGNLIVAFNILCDSAYGGWLAKYLQGIDWATLDIKVEFSEDTGGALATTRWEDNPVIRVNTKMTERYNPSELSNVLGHEFVHANQEYVAKNPLLTARPYTPVSNALDELYAYRKNYEYWMENMLPIDAMPDWWGALYLLNPNNPDDLNRAWQILVAEGANPETLQLTQNVPGPRYMAQEYDDMGCLIY